MKHFHIVAILMAITPLSVACAETAKPKEEYVTTATTKQLAHDELLAFPGKEVQVLEVELKPGWVGERHYHTGDVFVYVREGTFIVDVDGEGRKTFGPGQIYHEAVNTKMQARNGENDKTTKLH